jgi:UDP-N-acetylglucosamine acyltransferase
MIGGFSGVNKDVPPYMMIRGPAVVRGLNLVGMKRAGFSREIIKEIRKAYRILYISGETKDKSLQKLRESFSSEEVKHLVAFIEASKRGICHSRNSNEKDIK